MRLAFDARLINNSGIGTTIDRMLSRWSAEQRAQVELMTPPGWENPYHMSQRTVPEKVYGLAQHWGYGRRLARGGYDLFHMPHYDVPISYRGRLVVTVHDLIHYLLPEYSTKPFTRLYSHFLLSHVARRANRIICVSNSTKNDFLELFPQAEPRVKVVSPAVDNVSDAESDRLTTDRVLERHRLQPGYFLYVGNLRKGKNTLGLIRAYKILKSLDGSVPPLILVGHNSLPLSDLFPLPDGVRLLGLVDRGDLPVLYRQALGFVFPSFYEGFGLPPLEAMAHGAPVIVSNRASLPEVCGPAALYVDPVSGDDIAGKMLQLWREPGTRDQLRAAGFKNIQRFSWDRFAQQTWEIYEDVCKERPL
jgi:glycosyltransferase involved in cell wall biosynthesis